MNVITAVLKVYVLVGGRRRNQKMRWRRKVATSPSTVGSIFPSHMYRLQVHTNAHSTTHTERITCAKVASLDELEKSSFAPH